MNRSSKDPDSRKLIRREDLRVVSSDEENPRRETEVDDEDEERFTRFGPSQDEGIRFEDPLRVSLPSDRPRDISPAGESDGRGLGMVDQSDSATIAGYERAETELRRKKAVSAPDSDSEVGTDSESDPIQARSPKVS